MNKIDIQAKEDFLERLAAPTPIKAISELIWNGPDAGADEVAVRFELNGLSGIEKFRVKDSETGIEHDQVQALFGNLGESWKMGKGRFKGRALHGKSGQGRFKAFALGDRVEWQTVYNAGAARMGYRIAGNVASLTDRMNSTWAIWMVMVLPISCGGLPLPIPSELRRGSAKAIPN